MRRRQTKRHVSVVAISAVPLHHTAMAPHTPAQQFRTASTLTVLPRTAWHAGAAALPAPAQGSTAQDSRVSAPIIRPAPAQLALLRSPSSLLVSVDIVMPVPLADHATALAAATCGVPHARTWPFVLHMMVLHVLLQARVAHVCIRQIRNPTGAAMDTAMWYLLILITESIIFAHGTDSVQSSLVIGQLATIRCWAAHRTQRHPI